MANAREILKRQMLPRMVVGLSQVGWPSRAGASIRRALGRSGRVELYFAFDDPCSAVAVIDLAERLAGRRVVLILAPVVQRGIAGDPAVEAKRRYALEDARRLAARAGLTLTRREPVAEQSTAFLASWVASAAPHTGLVGFCVDSLRRLWLQTDGAVQESDYVTLWRAHLGSEPPNDDGARMVRRNERRMRRRGPYDTPAAWVHGQWFFAHDRLAQIGERLDELGWTVQR